MVWEFNSRQPKVDKGGKDGLMADDGARPPTDEERLAAKRRLQSFALPDERF